MLKLVRDICELNRRGFPFCFGGIRISRMHPMEGDVDADAWLRIDIMVPGCMCIDEYGNCAWTESPDAALKCEPLLFWPTTFPYHADPPWVRFREG